MVLEVLHHDPERASVGARAGARLVAELVVFGIAWSRGAKKRAKAGKGRR